MIRYDTDGITLVNDAGKRVGVRDEDYLPMLAIKDAQSAAASDNNAAGFKYHTDLANFQEALDEGRAVGLSSPAKPQMKTVADDGTVVVGPFVPALPNPVYPNVSPSASTKSAPAPDRTDVLLNLAVLINGKLDKLLSGGK